MTPQLVDDLFKVKRRPDGKEYTYQEVENALEKRLSGSYVRKLREGIIRNPGRDALLELCTFFHVPASYFFPELEGQDSGASRQALYDLAVSRVEDLLKQQEQALWQLERAAKWMDPEADPRLAELLDRGKTNQERLEQLLVQQPVSTVTSTG